MIDYIAVDFVKSLKIVRELYKFGQAAIGARRRAQIRTVLRALRAIYFFEDRTYSLLYRLSQKEEVSVTDLQRAEEGFRESGENAYEALEELEKFAYENKNLNVSIEVMSSIRDIVFGKGGARIGIIEFFMDLETQVENGTFNLNREANAVRASELKDILIELNTRIKEVDEALIPLNS